MLKCDRKQQNSVKQLSFNKIKKKKNLNRISMTAVVSWNKVNVNLILLLKYQDTEIAI